MTAKRMSAEWHRDVDGLTNVLSRYGPAQWARAEARRRADYLQRAVDVDLTRWRDCPDVVEAVQRARAAERAMQKAMQNEWRDDPHD